MLLFSLDKTFLSAHDNLQFYTLSSADKITIQVAVQYSAHIGFAPSLNMTRSFLEVSLSQICFVALCSCCTFCQILLAPYLYFNVIFQHFLVFTPLTEQIYHGGFTQWLYISSRPVCKTIYNFQGTKIPEGEKESILNTPFTDYFSLHMISYQIPRSQ